MQVFAEPDPDATTAPAGEQSQQSAASSQMEEPAVYSQDSAPLLTPDMSFESAESREHSIFSKSVQVDFEALKYQNIATIRKTPSRTKSAPRLFRNPLPKTPAAADPTLLKNDQLNIDDSGIVLESPPGITTYNFPSDVAEPGEHISDAEWLALEKQTLCPLERITALPVQGSEDQIVPESPGEVSDESGTKPQFNLSKFVFAG
jgi:exonuclease-1